MNIYFARLVDNNYILYDPVMEDLIPKNSLLDIIIRRSNRICIDNISAYIVSDPRISDVLDYIREDSKYPTHDEYMRNLLKEYCIFNYESYEEIFERELDFRNNTHNSILDKYHNLIKISDVKSMLDQIYDYLLNLEYEDKFIILEYIKPNKPFLNIEHGYLDIQYLYDIAEDHNVKIMVAGGYIFNSIMGIKIDGGDIDVFFLDSYPQDIIQYIKSVSEYFNRCESIKCPQCIDENKCYRRTVSRSS